MVQLIETVELTINQKLSQQNKQLLTKYSDIDRRVTESIKNIQEVSAKKDDDISSVRLNELCSKME